MAAATTYARYYTIQAGGGYHGNIGNLYRSGEFVQRGYGIGSLLIKAFKYLKPLAWNGLQALGAEGYKTGKGVFNDIIADKPLDQIIKNRGEEAVLGLAERGINKLKRKMQSKQSGNGIYKRKRARKKNNSSVGGRRKRAVTKQIGGRRKRRGARKKRKTKAKRTKRTLDIFQ